MSVYHTTVETDQGDVSTGRVIYIKDIEGNVNSEKYLNFMNNGGSVPLDWGPEKTKKLLAEQDAFFKKMIQDMGLYKEKK